MTLVDRLIPITRKAASLATTSAILLAAAMLPVGPAAAQVTPALEVVADTHASDIALSENLGAELYARDTAAYVAAGRMSEALQGEAMNEIEGWITVKEGEQYRVAFIGGSGEAARAYYLAFVENEEVIDSFAPPSGSALSEGDAAIWRARQDALSREFTRCADSYNPVIVPYNTSDEAGGLFVYLMPASAETKMIKAGGYELFDYAADGRTLNGRMAFTQNCLDIERTDNPEDSLVLSHTMTPYPQEHHVFISLLYNTDVYVQTMGNEIFWKVSGGKITPFRRGG